MQRVQNVSLQEILSMERSIPGCLLIIDDIRDLAENDLEDLETKENEMLLFQKLLETYPELPFYKFIEMFSLVGDHLMELIFLPGMTKSDSSMRMMKKLHWKNITIKKMMVR